MAKDPDFIILKPTAWLPEEEWTNILGAAVINPLSPTEDYTPDSPLNFNKNPLVEFSYDGFILQDKKMSNLTLELDVQGLGKLKWVRGAEDKVDLRGKRLYIKRLRRHSEFWKKITSESDEFKETVLEWASEKYWGRAKHQVCQIVGLLIGQDVVVARSDEETKDREARGEIALGTIIETVAASHGVPVSTGGAGNASSDASKAAISRKYFQVQGRAMYVLGLELKIIAVKGGELALTKKSPDFKHRLGKDGDVDINDLEIRDIEPGEWDELLSASDSLAPGGNDPSH